MEKINLKTEPGSQNCAPGSGLYENQSKKVVELKNYTPHQINLLLGDDFVALPPKGLARVSSSLEKMVKEIYIDRALSKNGIPIVDVVFSEVEGLPEEEENVFIVVSSMVLDAVKASGSGRKDLLAPAMQVRDEAGNVIGCRGFRS